MTPHAQRFFKDLTLPKRDRKNIDHAGLFGRMEGLHCFDVSALEGAVSEFMKQADLATCVTDMAFGMFLPSPRTWLEYFIDGNRTAIVVEAMGDRYGLSLVTCRKIKSIFFGYLNPVTSEMELSLNPDQLMGLNDTDDQLWQQFNYLIIRAVSFLDLINAPGTVTMDHHDPHAGFARALKKSGIEYPLKAWSEVRISHDSDAVSDGFVGPTSRRCLHFVRAHQRHLQSGDLTLVSHHWRGDPALGIKRTKYRVDR